MLDPNEILIGILDGYADANKWVGQPFERIKRLSNTKVGDVGQDFVEKLCNETGLDCEFPEKPAGERRRQNPWDVRIENTTFELKTATEDVKGAFQFNHIRYHREYQALLCIGIGPNDILMGAWSKAEATTGRAGTLATMEKGANAPYKLTKRRPQLEPVSNFKNQLRNLLSKLDPQ